MSATGRRLHRGRAADLRGAAHVPNVDLGGASRQSRLNDKDNQAIASMYRRTELNATVAEGQRIMSAARQEMDAEMQAANGNAVSADRLEQEARRIARFMRDQYNLGFVDVGGWDTHGARAGQRRAGHAAGPAGTRAGGLRRRHGRCLEADHGGGHQRIGRTFRENGNKGTDHGHGTVYWVMGGAVRGGRIAGRQVEVRRDTLFQDRDYPVLNEYRAVFAGLFARLYGLDAARLAQVFPGVRPLDLKLV